MRERGRRAEAEAMVAAEAGAAAEAGVVACVCRRVAGHALQRVVVQV